MNTYRNKKGKATGVQRELYWLYKNGYTFERIDAKDEGDDYDWILCKPPIEPLSADKRMIYPSIEAIIVSSVIEKIYGDLYPVSSLKPTPKCSSLLKGFEGLEDYELAKRNSKTSLYFGLESTPAVQDRLKDLDKEGKKSRYFGRIFWPAGIIDAVKIKEKKRPFLQVLLRQHD